MLPINETYTHYMHSSMVELAGMLVTSAVCPHVPNHSICSLKRWDSQGDTQ